MAAVFLSNKDLVKEVSSKKDRIEETMLKVEKLGDMLKQDDVLGLNDTEKASEYKRVGKMHEELRAEIEQFEKEVAKREEVIDSVKSAIDHKGKPEEVVANAMRKVIESYESAEVLDMLTALIKVLSNVDVLRRVSPQHADFLGTLEKNETEDAAFVVTRNALIEEVLIQCRSKRASDGSEPASTNHEVAETKARYQALGVELISAKDHADRQASEAMRAKADAMAAQEKALEEKTSIEAKHKKAMASRTEELEELRAEVGRLERMLEDSAGNGLRDQLTQRLGELDLPDSQAYDLGTREQLDQHEKIRDLEKSIKRLEADIEQANCHAVAEHNQHERETSQKNKKIQKLTGLVDEAKKDAKAARDAETRTRRELARASEHEKKAADLWQKLKLAETREEDAHSKIEQLEEEKQALVESRKDVMQATVVAAEEKIKDMTRCLERLKVDNSELRSKEHDKVDELMFAEEKAAQLESSRNTAIESRNYAQDQLRIVRSDVKRLEARNEKDKSILAETRKHEAELALEIRQVRSESLALQEQVAELQEADERLRDELSSMGRALEQAKGEQKEIPILQQRTEKLAGTLQQAKAEQRRAEEARELTLVSVSSLQDDVGVLTDRLSTAEIDLKETRIANATLRKQKLGLDVRHWTEWRRMRRAEKSEEQLAEEVEELKGKLNGLDSQLNDQLNTARKRAQLLQTGTESLQEQLECLRSENQRHQDRDDELAQQVTTNTVEKGGLEEQVDLLQSQNWDLQEQLRESEKEVETAKETAMSIILDLRSKMDGLRREAEEKQEEFSEQQAREEAIRQQAGKLREELSRQQSCIEHLCRDAEEKRAELEKLSGNGLSVDVLLGGNSIFTGPDPAFRWTQRGFWKDEAPEGLIQGFAARVFHLAHVLEDPAQSDSLRRALLSMYHCLAAADQANVKIVKSLLSRVSGHDMTVVLEAWQLAILLETKWPAHCQGVVEQVVANARRPPTLGKTLEALRSGPATARRYLKEQDFVLFNDDQDLGLAATSEWGGCLVVNVTALTVLWTVNLRYDGEVVLVGAEGPESEAPVAMRLDGTDKLWHWWWSHGTHVQETMSEESDGSIE